MLLPNFGLCYSKQPKWKQDQQTPKRICRTELPYSLLCSCGWADEGLRISGVITGLLPVCFTCIANKRLRDNGNNQLQNYSYCGKTLHQVVVVNTFIDSHIPSVMPENSSKNISTGRRTGIRVDTTNVDAEDGMEDPDAFFAAAAPQRQTMISFAASPPRKNKPRHLLNKSRQSVDTNDLSAVLTAAPDPPADETADDDAIPEDDDLLPPPPPEDGPLKDTDDLFEGEDSDEDEVPPPNETTEDATEKSAIAGQEGQKEDNVLLDTQPEEEDELPPSMDPPQDQQEDEDDDKEGPGFDMNVDGDEDTEPEPEAPSKKKTPTPRKKAGKRKKLPTTDDIHSTGEDEPRPKKTTKAKKKKKNTVKSKIFSPKGYPQARSYDVVPLSDLETDSTDEPPPHVRRSKRVRTAPLEHWRNERQVYGPNDFNDEDFDGVRNMSVVTGIQRPNPTPYKKKTQPKNRDGPPRKTKSTTADAGDEEFDLTALRKKYKINEGKHAEVWDETTQEITNTSTYELVPKGLCMTGLTHRLSLLYRGRIVL